VLNFRSKGKSGKEQLEKSKCGEIFLKLQDLGSSLNKGDYSIIQFLNNSLL